MDHDHTGMLERQQLLLQQLGIMQWIPRGQDVVKKSLQTLWRESDEKAVNQSINILVSPLQSDIDVESVKPTIETHKSISDIIVPVINKQSLLEDEKPQLVEALTEIISQSIRFDYQILLHEKFLIFAEIHDSAQRQLFANIQKACFATQTQLKWPLYIQSWDSHDLFAQSYLQGFFALHDQPLLIVLGDIALPTINESMEVFTLPSLQQMLASPLEKRRLWQKIYPFIYDIEQNNEKESSDF